MGRLLHFDDSLFTDRPARLRHTRAEKRRDRQRHALATVTSYLSPTPLDITAEGLQELQTADSTLEAVGKTARGESGTAGQGFFKKDGLLYRRYVPLGCEEDDGA